MSEKLNTIVGKQNDFATRLIGGGSISSGVINTILTLTPPAGQRVRLTHLSTASGTNQLSISITIGGVTVIAFGSVNGSDPSLGGFSIGSYQPYAAGNPPNGNYKYFTGATDEVLNIISSNVTTTTIYYGYQFGE